jgi:hypothetical protein
MFILGLLRKFRESAYKEAPVERGNGTIFRESRPARYFYRFGITFFGAMAVLSFVVKDVEWYIRAGYIPMFAFLFMRWPWATKITGQGVSRRSYFGVLRTIEWSDVTALNYDRRAGRFTVIARSGATIRCSAFMVSPPVFYREVYRRAPQLGPMPTRDDADFAGVDDESWYRSLP